jgi:hypothetical protein
MSIRRWMANTILDHRPVNKPGQTALACDIHKSLVLTNAIRDRIPRYKLVVELADRQLIPHLLIPRKYSIDDSQQLSRCFVRVPVDELFSHLLSLF